MELISLSIISVSHGLLNTIASASNVRRILERGGGGQKIMKIKRKISLLRITPFSSSKLGKDQKKGFSLKISPVFGPKLGEDQKNKKKAGLYPDSVLLCAQTFCPSYNGGRPCRNSAYYSMLIILSWRPKRGAWHHGPP